MVVYHTTSVDEWTDISQREFAQVELDGTANDFVGHIDALNLPAGIWFGEVRSSPCNYLHAPKGKFRPTRDDLLVVIHRSHEPGLLNHMGHSTILNFGDVVSVDLSLPYNFSYVSSVEQTVIKLPRHTISNTCFDNAGYAVSISKTSTLRVLGATVEEIRRNQSVLRRAEPGHEHQNRLMSETEALSMTLRDLVSYNFGRNVERGQLSESRAQLAMAKEFIESNYWNPLLKREDLAQYLHVSTRRLSSIFEDVGTSPATFLREFRLNKSLALIESLGENANLYDVSYRAGFGDISTFSRAFKNHFSMTPAEYRAQWKNMAVTQPDVTASS